MKTLLLFLFVTPAFGAPLVIDTCSSYVLTGNTVSCASTTPPPATCPPGQVGTPPNCAPPPPASDDLANCIYQGFNVLGGSAKELSFAAASSGPSSAVGGFGDGAVWLFKLTVPPGTMPTTRIGQFQVAEYQGQPTSRQLTLSRFPCDFRPVDVYGNNGPINASNNGTTAAIQFTVGVDRSMPGVMLAGTRYYFSARNWSDFPLPNGSWSCGAGNVCNATYNYQTTGGQKKTNKAKPKKR